MSEPMKRKRGRNSASLFTETKEETESLIANKETDKSRERFSTMKHEFQYFGVSQQSQFLLRKIAFSPMFEVEPVRFLEMLNQRVCSLLLNEVEVVVLSLYLDNLRWVLIEDNLEEFVLFAAFAAKKYMNQDIAPIVAQVIVEDPEFIDKFEYWHNLNKKSLHVKPKVLNRKFRELTQPFDTRRGNPVLDYNAFVEQILNSTDNCTTEDLPAHDGNSKVYLSYKIKSKMMMSQKRDDDHILVRPKPTVHFTHGKIERISTLNNCEAPSSGSKYDTST